MKIRTFIALELPQTVRDTLYAYTELISGHDKPQGIRWLPKENYNLTLSFLGNVEYVLISSLQLKLEQNLSSKQAVPCRFSEITPFPFSGTLHEIAIQLLSREASGTKEAIARTENARQ